MLTDCPHREKLGWLEVFPPAGRLHHVQLRPCNVLREDRQRHGEAQLANGMVPDIAPEYTVFGGGFRDSPEWGSAYVICPWLVYQMYGDRDLLARHYEGMKRYVAFLQGTATNQSLGTAWATGTTSARAARVNPNYIQRRDRHGRLLSKTYWSCKRPRRCWAKPTSRGESRQKPLP